jgi:hypothetical protein
MFPFSAAFGLTAALGFLVRVSVLCASKSGKTPELFLSLFRLFAHFPALRSACLADGSLPRETKRFQVETAAPTPLLSAALGLSCRRLATAGNEALIRWGLPLPHPRFPLRSAYLSDGSLPRATKRFSGLDCCPHTPAFRSARLVLQKARYRGNRNAFQVGAAAPIHPRFPLRSAFVLQTARFRGQRSACQVGAAAPKPLV